MYANYFTVFIVFSNYLRIYNTIFTTQPTLEGSNLFDNFIWFKSFSILVPTHQRKRSSLYQWLYTLINEFLPF